MVNLEETKLYRETTIIRRFSTKTLERRRERAPNSAAKYTTFTVSRIVFFRVDYGTMKFCVGEQIAAKSKWNGFEPTTDRCRQVPISTAAICTSTTSNRRMPASTSVWAKPRAESCSASTPTWRFYVSTFCVYAFFFFFFS